MTARAVLLLAALHAALALAILLGGMAAGHAGPVAWRIEVRACRADACRPLPGSARRWDGLYACRTRAARIAADGDFVGVLPPGTRVEARCLPVEGTPRA